MKTTLAVVLGCLALNCWAQVTELNPTNAIPPGLTNAGPVTAANGPAGATLTDPQEVVWLEDATPEGAWLSAAPDDPWLWTNAFWNGSEFIGPYSGSLMHLSPLAQGWHQHFFSQPAFNLAVNPGDSLIAYIHLPSTNAPAAVKLLWLVGETNGPGSWDHWALWAGDNVRTNTADTNAFYAGPLPAPGQWVRLSVPAAAVGLEGQVVEGISFAIYDGAAAWDRAGKFVPYLATSGGPGLNGPGALSQSGSCVNPPVGLVGWWQAENNCLDFLGADPGTNQGNLTYVAGEVGNAFSLNGTDADVLVPASGTLNVGTGPGFTVEAWINPADLASRPIVEWNNPNHSPAYGVHLWSSVPTPWGTGPGSLFANLVDTYGGDHWCYSPSNLLATGAWQHVALTFTKSSYLASLYLNGTLVGSATFSPFSPQTAWDLYFGARVAGGGATNWLGQLDEVSLYNKVLGAAEISSIYNAGSAGKCTNPPSCVQPPAGLLSWWPAEGDCTDRLGLNPGAAQGALSYTTGEVYRAFNLNGSADVWVQASSNLNVGTGSFTVETWINPADLVSRPIVEWNSGGGPIPYGVHLWTSVPTNWGSGPGSLFANLVDTAGRDHWCYSPANLLTTGAWHHVALVYDHTAGNAYVYLNGGQVGSTNVGVYNPQTSYPLYFGARVAGGGATNWLGQLDEVSLYNQALSQPQLQSIYNAGAAGKCFGLQCSPVNVSHRQATQGEPAITVNPANPSNIFVVANDDSTDNLFTGVSHDGAATWTTNNLPNTFRDPSAAFDAFGNLFVCCVDPANRVVVLLSTNGGGSCAPIATNSGPSGLDQPTITTGPGGSYATGSVWVTCTRFGWTNGVVAWGAPVTGLGAVGPWTTPALLSGNTETSGWGDIAIGPGGQVAVTFQDTSGSVNGPTPVPLSVDPDGLGTNSGFRAPWVVVTSQVGYSQTIPAMPHHNCTVDVEPGLAWDCTSGGRTGRLYMVYTDRGPFTNDTDIYVIYSNDNGGNWSSRLKVNDDSTTNSQFYPRIALDQTSGNVAVSWYDCRGDTNNVKTRFYAAVSRDGGASFSANIQLEPGESDARLTSSGHDYYDYTGLAYYGGVFYPAWADNSNSTGDNPDGTGEMDIYVARVWY